MTEREILATADHPFIVTLHWSFQSPKKVFFFSLSLLSPFPFSFSSSFLSFPFLPFPFQPFLFFLFFFLPLLISIFQILNIIAKTIIIANIIIIIILLLFIFLLFFFFSSSFSYYKDLFCHGLLCRRCLFSNTSTTTQPTSS